MFFLNSDVQRLIWAQSINNFCEGYLLGFHSMFNYF